MDSFLTARRSARGSTADRLGRLCELVSAARHLVVLTGAGCSTGSGIPGYRDHAGRWKGAEPVLYGDFLADAGLRKRYWARSLSGYARVARAEPNAAHRALVKLEARRLHGGLITQNVDGLHRRAGSENVLELHGNLDTVVCLQCHKRIDRGEVQAELEASNPDWIGRTGTPRPDGDVALEADDYEHFDVPCCYDCGGLLKPDVVFFGEAVPKERAQSAMQRVGGADAMLIVGSSLMVLSGFRLVRDACRRGVPVAAINRGTTRADDLLTTKVDAPCEQALVMLLDMLD